jgi:hypothetical protein
MSRIWVAHLQGNDGRVAVGRHQRRIGRQEVTDAAGDRFSGQRHQPVGDGLSLLAKRRIVHGERGRAQDQDFIERIGLRAIGKPLAHQGLRAGRSGIIVALHLGGKGGARLQGDHRDAGHRQQHPEGEHVFRPACRQNHQACAGPRTVIHQKRRPGAHEAPRAMRSAIDRHRARKHRGRRARTHPAHSHNVIGSSASPCGRMRPITAV